MACHSLELLLLPPMAAYRFFDNRTRASPKTLRCIFYVRPLVALNCGELLTASGVTVPIFKNGLLLVWFLHKTVFICNMWLHCRTGGLIFVRVISACRHVSVHLVWAQIAGLWRQGDAVLCACSPWLCGREDGSREGKWVSECHWGMCGPRTCLFADLDPQNSFGSTDWQLILETLL